MLPHDTLVSVVLASKPGGRVLVIDDEPLLRATLQQILGDEGYIVDVASDGAAGLLRAQQHRPDVILLDLMMPTMNGKQFLQALRAEPSCATLPVLIMTAVQGIATNLALLGVGEVLEKPFDAEDLLSKVALAMYRSVAEGNEHLTGERPPVAVVAYTRRPATSVIFTSALLARPVMPTRPWNSGRTGLGNTAVQCGSPSVTVAEPR